MNCWKCVKPGATIPDPCCGAPDCENLGDYIHFECMSPDQQRTELALTNEMAGLL